MKRSLCVGIDPAPSKRGATVAHFILKDGIIIPGEISPYSHAQLRGLINEKTESEVLFAWDSPLTGPASPLDLDNDLPYDFTKRPIERAIGALKLPPGISVQGFGSCAHWTISRNILGLPIVGPYDQQANLPLELVENAKFLLTGRQVVEVHPALAIWLWLVDSDLNGENAVDFRYKVSRNHGATACREVRKKLIEGLIAKWEHLGLKEVVRDAQQRIVQFTQNVDDLDAYVAGVLAALLRTGSTEVRVFGDRQKGTFLLPVHPQVETQLQKLESFVH